MDILKSVNQIAVVQVLYILLGAWVLITLAKRLLPWLAERFSGRHRLFLLASTPVVAISVIAAAAWLIISEIIEPTFENLVALLGALGLALGFAFKDYVSSLVAGIVTLYERPYRLGDWISVEGAYGEVRSISSRTVEIVTPEDTVVVIPHLKLWEGLIFNANDGTQNLQCAADFYLHPQHDSRRVRQTLEDVGLTSAFLQIRKPVHVVVQEKPWGTHYRLKAYPVDPRDQFRFITDLTMRGKAALSELGVRFAVTPVAGREGPEP